MPIPASIPTKVFQLPWQSLPPNRAAGTPAPAHPLR